MWGRPYIKRPNEGNVVINFYPRYHPFMVAPWMSDQYNKPTQKDGEYMDTAENTSQEKLQFGMHNMFARMTNLPLDLLRANSYEYNDTTQRRVTRQDIKRWLKDPHKYANNLRDASIYLYEISTQYRRVINYFAGICPLNYIVYPFKFDPQDYNPKKFSTAYKKALNYLEIMNIPHEMHKALVIAWREDLFAGYIFQTKDSFYIMKLPFKYVKIASIVDGCILVAFDFTYFDGHPDDLEAWGVEFQEKYELYRNDRSNMRWQLLDEKRQFCIKISEDVRHILVPLMGCFLGIFDIEDYKDLSKGATILRNYKALGLKLPTDEKGNLLIDKELADEFYYQLCNVTPENIGVFQTPMDVQSFDFEKNGAEDPDKTYEAIRNFYNDVGVSSLLFGSDKQTAASLNISITADEALCFAVNRQIERNINRLLKTAVGGSVKFQITILDISRFHLQQYHDMLVKDAQLGIPVKSAISASLGFSQPVMSAMMYMENDILKLHEDMIPLSSVVNNSDDSEDEEDGTLKNHVGRPTAEERGEEISDSNEITREHDSNASR